MDVTTLSTSMVNQAAASGGVQGNLSVQKPAIDAEAPKTNGDTVDLSPEARAKATATNVAPAATDTSNITTRITKLQKQLQQEQGSSNLPDDKKRSEMAALRSQIMMLQSQLQK